MVAGGGPLWPAALRLASSGTAGGCAWQPCGAKRSGPGQNAATDGDRWGACDPRRGALIRRGCNLSALCYAAVTARLIHRPAESRASEHLAINDEPGALRHLVVELHRGVVGFV